MPWYVVDRPEVWVHSALIEAESAEEALSIADSPCTTEEDFGTEYSHTKDRETWSVRKASKGDLKYGGIPDETPD